MGVYADTVDAVKGWESWDIKHKSIIILMEIFLRLIKCMFENIKCGINCYRASPLSFKYYITKLGGGVLICTYRDGGSKIMENTLT